MGDDVGWYQIVTTGFSNKNFFFFIPVSRRKRTIIRGCSNRLLRQEKRNAANSTVRRRRLWKTKTTTLANLATAWLPPTLLVKIHKKLEHQNKILKTYFYQIISFFFSLVVVVKSLFCFPPSHATVYTVWWLKARSISICLLIIKASQSKNIRCNNNSLQQVWGVKYTVIFKLLSNRNKLLTGLSNAVYQ